MPITDIDKFLSFFNTLSEEEINEALDEFAAAENAENVVYAEDYIAFMKAQQVHSNTICSAEIVTKPNPKNKYNLTQQLYPSIDEYALAA